MFAAFGDKCEDGGDNGCSGYCAMIWASALECWWCMSLKSIFMSQTLVVAGGKQQEPDGQRKCILS